MHIASLERKQKAKKIKKIKRNVSAQRLVKLNLWFGIKSYTSQSPLSLDCAESGECRRLADLSTAFPCFRQVFATPTPKGRTTAWMCRPKQFCANRISLVFNSIAYVLKFHTLINVATTSIYISFFAIFML